MTVKKVQLYLDRDKTIEASPETSAKYVTLSDGNDLQKVLDNDLTTPTVVHEETSFKVGVGDVNVSSSVVDGEVGRMVIKGKTYQNILPEPSTPVLTNNKEMFKVNEGLDPNAEVVDGISKSAILSGQTLVNLATHSKRQNINVQNLSESNGRLTWDTTGSWGKVGFTVQGKPNTAYCIKYSNKHETLGIYIRFLDGLSGTTQPNAQLSPTCRKFTTDATGVFTLTLEQGETTTGSWIQNPMILEYQEGMENWGIPYFTGMTSCKLPVLTTTGKNLFDGELENGAIGVNGDLLPSTIAKRTVNFIKVKPNTTYSLSCNNYNSFFVHEYNENYSAIAEKIPNGSNIFVTNPETTYIKFNSHASSEFEIPANHQIQFEESLITTSYEPYKSNILTTSEDVVLRGIGEGSNRVEDELDCLTGEVVEYIDEIMFDGSSDENWVLHTQYTDSIVFRLTITKLYNPQYCMCDKFIGVSSTTAFSNGVERIKIGTSTTTTIYVNILNSKLSSIGVVGFKTWLQSNPINVQLVLATPTTKTVDLSIIDQDGNTPEGLHFFKDGHIQLSSGADNSLIPTLDYQAKTSNSYVMDLMKTNTKYTMKAKTASGTFTIDGTSYGAGTNGTFTTPSSMTNKLLVMSNKTNEEVMILEGDMVSKSIPYFKGIKSAFEDESKIEVLSTGRNVFSDDNTMELGAWTISGGNYVTNSEIRCKNNFTPFPKGLKNGDKMYIVLSDTSINSNTNMHIYDENKKLVVTLGYGSSSYIEGTNFINGVATITIRDISKCRYFSFRAISANTDCKFALMMNDVAPYKPHKSNSTKIPLLSPLRSLPNGVCDELIIDRMKKKATLIRRLDCVTFDGSSDENWHTWGSTNSTSHLNNYHYVDGTNNTKNLKVKVDPSWIVSRLGYGGGYTSKKTGASLSSSYFAFSIPKNSIGAGSGDTDSMYEKSGRVWLSQNPITVYYELATPVVTEIDLENFPLIYKDGHIFLNSEIAPVVEIDYNVNQAQQIQANNETLQRHELDILDLDNLIVSFVNAEYKLRLLKFNMELSMMALAE